MAGVFFALALTMTLTRSALVVDAVNSPPGSSSRFVARATKAIMSTAPAREEKRHSSSISQRQHPASPSRPQKQGSAGILTVRTLHNRLLAMHFAATICMVAGTADYFVPPSEILCRVAGGVLVCGILLYDASLVLFLLAKTSVTNGTRTLARWETYVIWWSRFYGWGYLPVCAVLMIVVLPTGIDDEGLECVTGAHAKGENAAFSDTIGYTSNNAMLIVQFVLLLALFVKPLVSFRGSTQAGTAVYRKVVVRNVVCTASVVFTYTITTISVVLVWLSDTMESEKVQILRNVIPAINILFTLCLTEVALPLGFSSCFKSVADIRHPHGDQIRQAVVSPTSRKPQLKSATAGSAGSCTRQTNQNPIVPFEEEDEIATGGSAGSATKQTKKSPVVPL